VTAQKLVVAYNLEYASCIGSLIYLSMMHCDTIFAINKLAKYTKRPRKKHFEVLFHFLRYLRDHCLLGIKFYSEYHSAPILKTLQAEGITQNHPFSAFWDSSWNDDVDHGRSTGCYLITYMGGIVDHSSNLPDPGSFFSRGRI
jgi:hypothetical protein